ncbi:hypothetical protein FB45DRAFT_1070371 [Roridomyces roridus]|uniref:MYND-type domain-containing protein n=1 Tax=Roridomyces roridus TaxID=1738132 RepID=A0AAD7F8M8_9AGAR|nr:hypothetical protein FB45DRAFT_1070371 [Roridomyces roridus]
MHPSLRIENIAGLPVPTKLLAMSAARGVVADVDQLFHLMSESPQALRLILFPVFYVHLNVDDLPLLREQLKSVSTLTLIPDRIECALLSLGALGGLQNDFVPEARDEVWSSAWAWIQFLEDEMNAKIAPGVKSADAIRVIFLRLLTGFCSNPHPSPFTSQPRIREFLAAGWAAAANDPETSPLLLSCAPLFFFANSDMANPTHSREIIAGAGGTMNHLASLIVRTIPRILPPPTPASNPDPDFNLEHRKLTLISILKLADHPPLTNHLASHGIVDGLCQTLCAFGGSVTSNTSLVVSLTMSGLINNLDVFPSMTRVKEGLEAGLLRAVVLCACRQDARDFYARLEALLVSMIPQALVYHSVLSSMRAALNDVEPLTGSRAFRESKLFGVWQDFVRVTTDRLDLLARFDRGEIGRTRACDHIECTSPVKRDDDLKQCSGCRSAFYCSNTCQSQDWAGHKKRCSSLLEQGNKLAYLSSELKFLRAVLHHDYENARAEVTAKHSKALEKDPNALCAFVAFDYRRGLAVEITSGTASPNAEFTRYHGARVASSGGRLELHVMALNVGKDRTEWLVLPMRVEAEGSVTTH